MISPSHVDLVTPSPPSSSSAVRVETYESPGELERLTEAWQGLLACCPEATPFHAPEWLLPWISRFGAGPLRVMAAFRGDALVGLAPWRLVPTPTGRTLCFVGSPITDYHGVLVAPGAAGEGVLSAFMREVAACSASWDRCDFEQLRGEDPLLTVDMPGDFVSEVQDQDPCPQVLLGDDVPTFNGSLPSALGPRLQRALRTLRRMGPVSFEQADEHNVDELMESLFRLHAARWATRHMPGVLNQEVVQDFHREVAAGMLLSRRLRLTGLRLCGHIEAVVYGFAHGRRFYSYIGGFNPVLAKYSLGLVTLWQAMLSSIDEGLNEFDLLRGEEPYKFRFGAVVRRNRRRLIRHV